MSESKSITKPIMDAMAQAGYFCIRLNSGVAKMGARRIHLCPAGTADLLICMPYRLPIWVETKIPSDMKRKGETADKQYAFRLQVEALGHVYIRAMTLDDVLAVIRPAQELHGEGA